TTSAAQLPGGTHTITAVYTPAATDLNFAGTTPSNPSNSVTEKVTPHGTTTTITSPTSPDTTTFGTPPTFTATVTPTILDPSNGNAEPHGTVTFLDNGSPIGTVNLVDVGGTATATFTPTPAQLTGGTHNITASFTPSDGNFSASPSVNTVTET